MKFMQKSSKKRLSSLIADIRNAALTAAIVLATVSLILALMPHTTAPLELGEYADRAESAALGNQGFYRNKNDLIVWCNSGVFRYDRNGKIYRIKKVTEEELKRDQKAFVYDDHSYYLTWDFNKAQFNLTRENLATGDIQKLDTSFNDSFKLALSKHAMFYGGSILMMYDMVKQNEVVIDSFVKDYLPTESGVVYTCTSNNGGEWENELRTYRYDTGEKSVIAVTPLERLILATNNYVAGDINGELCRVDLQSGSADVLLSDYDVRGTYPPYLYVDKLEDAPLHLWRINIDTAESMDLGSSVSLIQSGGYRYMHTNMNRNIYGIYDEKWVYGLESGNNLMRIAQDGSGRRERLASFKYGVLRTFYGWEKNPFEWFCTMYWYVLPVVFVIIMLIIAARACVVFYKSKAME